MSDGVREKLETSSLGSKRKLQDVEKKGRGWRGQWQQLPSTLPADSFGTLSLSNFKT